MKVTYGIFVFFIGLHARAQVINSPQFNAGRWKVITTVDMYSSNENFGNSTGRKEPLPDGNEYENTVGKLLTHYGLGKDWELFGGFTYSRAKSLTDQVQRTQSAFTDLHLGANYRAVEGSFSLYPGMALSVPLTTIDPATDDVLLSEGAFALSLPVYMDYKWSFLALYANLTPSFLGDERGARVFYALGAKKRVGPFILNVELNGMDTFVNDGLTETPNLRTDVVNRVNGGSFRYYSINPGVYHVAAQARFRITQMFIAGVGYAQELNGSRHSAGTSIIGYLEVRLPEFGSSPPPKVSRKKKRPSRRGYEEVVEETVIIYEDNVDFNEDFREETSDRDLELFDEDFTRPGDNRYKDEESDESGY